MKNDQFEVITLGGVMGLAVGDALGVPAEFMSREELGKSPVTGMQSGGAHGQPQGTWSDDTSLTVCLMESLIHGVDYNDQMQRFTDWMLHGAYSAHDELFDIGGGTKAAIFKYAHGYPPLECGGLSDNSCGNGSLMRILPAVLYSLADNEDAVFDNKTASLIHDMSRLTHAHSCCLVACGIYASIVFGLAGGGELASGCKHEIQHALAYYSANPKLTGQLERFFHLNGIELLHENDIQSTGYVVHTLEAALWCLNTTASYEECVLKAVNLGDDTDTTAAVAGSLAGIRYGYDAIPRGWLDALARREYLEGLCKRFAAAAKNAFEKDA